MPTTTQKGLGREHQKERARLLARADGQICWRCGRPMWPSAGQTLDLDHVRARCLGGTGPRVMTHSRCNRQAGARLANQRSAQRRARVTARPARPDRPVRSW